MPRPRLTVSRPAARADWTNQRRERQAEERAYQRGSPWIAARRRETRSSSGSCHSRASSRGAISDGYELEDLEQVAAIGLVKAIGRFDPDRGLAFSTFAFPTIMGELRHHLRDHGWSVRVPRDLQELYVRVERATGDLATELGRAPTAAELADRVGSSVEQVLETRQATTARRADSLDQPRNGTEDPDAAGIEVAIDEVGFAAAEDAAVLDDLLKVLSERERLVLQLRFGEDLTQSQIGEIAGVSQMQVSRLVRRAIAQLQDAAARQQVNPAGARHWLEAVDPG